ncbi:insulinase family protein [Shimia sp. R11_0]|uniref:M16 family metallopeptidase n=1 Tax=Shimia sp. R11_0 TaxID=2821096 RepID=UPI001ADD3C53|nr:insulinase family protein [Shimia sp. R11_0]MBO9479723.1 insulinase family protein [Shimia sp. R11_0]
MRPIALFLFLAVATLSSALHAQPVIPLENRGGLHSAFVVPTDKFDRIDVQLIVLSGAYDDPEPSGTAHLTEHLAAFSADATVLRQPRERDIFASTSNVATVYTNSGTVEQLDQLLHLSRAVLDTPTLPKGFAESEISIVEREILLHERQYPHRWLRRLALQNLYGSLRGRADNAVDDLPQLSLEKAYEFHKTHYVASNVILIVSGKVDVDKVKEQVATIFGDTQATALPSKPWLNQKPIANLNAVQSIKTDRIPRDTIYFAKFIDFEDRDSSYDMQGAFFLTSSILQKRLAKSVYYTDLRFIDFNSGWYFAVNADLEITIDVQLMPGFDLEVAHETLIALVNDLLSEPITAKEIQEARIEELVNARESLRRPSMFLQFLKNLAADGFPPITPSLYEELINSTSDQDVIYFANTIVKSSPTSVILAEKVD